MNCFKSAHWMGLARLCLHYLLGRRVTPADYAAEYDAVSHTYNAWEELMLPHTEQILDLSLLPGGGSPRIIDLACGTGSVTSSLLARLGDRDARITCVDISQEMLRRCKERLPDDRIEFVQADGLNFLGSVERSTVDAIYCGWGMVYMPHARLLPLCAAALRPGGVVGSIMNCRGTLAGVEDMFIEVMSKRPGEVSKVMDIRFHLPADEADFGSWFTRYGFARVMSGHGEEIVSRATPEALLAWLRETGAIAGTGKLFRDQERVDSLLIDAMARRFAAQGSYQVNHKFVYGVYRHN